MSTHDQRVKHYHAIIAGHFDDFQPGDQYPDGDDSAEDPGDDCARFALIEQSNITSQTWITLWDTVADAVRYHLGQDYADNWLIEHIVDLDTSEPVADIAKAACSPDGTGDPTRAERAEAALVFMERLHEYIEGDQEPSAADQCQVLYEFLGELGLKVS